jgi:hypothetical protein
VAYRRQRDLEQGRFVERFGAAAPAAVDVAAGQCKPTAAPLALTYCR